MDAKALYEQTVAGWTAAVSAVPPGAWERTTPCSDWSVRDLVNHVVGEDLWTVPLVEGRTIAEVGSRFDGEVLGDDPVSTALGAAEQAVKAVSQQAPQRAIVHLSYGDESLEEYLRQLAADHLIHGWDLAVATDGDATLDPEHVAAISQWFADREDMYRAAGVIGSRAPSSGDASSDLLAAFGRADPWRR